MHFIDQKAIVSPLGHSNKEYGNTQNNIQTNKKERKLMERSNSDSVKVLPVASRLTELYLVA